MVALVVFTNVFSKGSVQDWVSGLNSYIDEHFTLIQKAENIVLDSNGCGRLGDFPSAEVFEHWRNALARIVFDTTTNVAPKMC